MTWTLSSSLFSFFFFHDPATTEIYTSVHTLSLHDALPISTCQCPFWRRGLRPPRAPPVAGGTRRFGDRLDHLGVARAPAEVAGNRVADVVLGRLRVLGEERGGRHQHARDAEAALRHAVTHERVLHGRERPAARQPLDGGHGAPSRLHREHEAARHELAIQMHGARAAVAGAATLLGSGEAEVLAERVEQRDVRLHERLDGLAVDGEAQDLLGHDETSVQAVARSSATARSAARAIACEVSGWPSSACSAAVARTGTGATAASAMRTFVQTPSASETCEATPTTAMSSSRRGV